MRDLLDCLGPTEITGPEEIFLGAGLVAQLALAQTPKVRRFARLRLEQERAVQIGERRAVIGEVRVRVRAPPQHLGLVTIELERPIVVGERAAAVRAGTGKLDQAEDFVAIPGLFAEFAEALVGKDPFPADKIELLSTLGGTLVKYVRPGNAVIEVAKRSKESILRDQLAAMVADQYDHLQVLATIALVKRRADELLPALRSSVGFARAASVSAAIPEANGAPGATTTPALADG